MSFHILEVRKVDERGDIISSEYFIVNESGRTVDGPFSKLLLAINRLKEFENKYTPPRSSSSGLSCDM